MSDNEACLLRSPTRTPWNKGKLIGAKPPLRPKHVWSIRTRLMIEGRTRDSPCSIWPSIASYEAATSSPEGRAQEIGRIPVHWPARHGPVHHDPPICTTHLRVGRQHWTGPEAFRHPFAPADKGDADLSAHWQFTSRAASARRAPSDISESKWMMPLP